MNTSLLGGQKQFDKIKEDFDGTLGRLKKKVVELQGVGQGDRRNALSHEIGGELQELDGMLAEMSKEVDLAKGREKSDWQSDLARSKKDKQVLQDSFNRLSVLSGASGGSAGGAEDARTRMLRLKAMQDSTSDRATRIRRNLEETEQTGAETLRAMESQSDRYAGVVDRLKDAASNIDDASAANRRIYRGQFYTKIILYSTMLVVLAGVVSFILFALKIPPFGHH